MQTITKCKHCLEKINFTAILFAVIIFINSQSWGQQVIGSFPSMDGGFENQTTIATLSSIGVGVQSNVWTVNNVSGVSTLNSSNGRSGSKYVTFSATASRRLQSPTASDQAIVNSTAYTVQYFYKSTAIPANGQVGVSVSGTGTPGTYVSSGLTNTNNIWTKVQVSATSGSLATTPRYGIGVIRFSAASANSIDIDDFVMYAGSADNAAPNSTATVTVNNATTASLDISWDAAAGGVDGGGYVVVRYDSNPNADNDPNQNGIYALGNTITNGTGSLTGIVRYIGTSTTFTDNVGLVEGGTYYYKVYTVDKAFNYSVETIGSGTTSATGLLTPPGLIADAVDNNVDNNIDITFADNLAWRNAITSVKIGTVALVLNADYVISAGNLQLKPSGLNSLLTISGIKSIIIEATGYSNATVSQLINAGVATKLVVKTEPSAPLLNAAVLSTQPAVYIQDQYGNITTNTDDVSASVNSGNWILGGTTTVAAVAGTATFSNLTASSATAITGADIIFTSGTLTSAISSAFNIPAPGAVISVTPFSLTAFTYIVGSGPSSSQTFEVSGTNLTGNIDITAPVNYEISLSSSNGFTNILSLTPNSGIISATPVYVRLKADLLAANYNNEIINITSVTAITKTVTLNGSVSCVSPIFPFYENFNYTTGTDLTANCWNISGSNATPTIKVGSSPLSYSGYLSSDLGKCAIISPTGQDVNKTFVPQTTGTIYTSFLVNVTSANLIGDYFFNLGQSVIGTTYRGRIFVKKDASNNLAFGISHSSSTANYTSFSYALNTTYLIVLKYEIIDGVSNDISSIYINPTLNAAIPSTGWIVKTDASSSDLTDIGSVALRQGTAANAPELNISGIRVSNNWEDIVGALLTEPTNHATTFVATTNTATSITNTWNDNDGLQAATSFLILANTTGVFSDPIDGIFEINDIDLSDGSGRINVNHGLQTYEWIGLTSGTQYYFKIYPYNGTGAAVNYKIDGTVPQSNATTLSLNKTLNLTLLLEGLFNGVDGMTPAQGDAGNQFSATIADQITVELYDPSNLTLPVETHNPVDLNINGTCSVNLSSSVLNSNYYIVIKHRNSIETWSANPLSFSGSNINYNFTTGANQAYWNNLNSINGVYVIYGGDVFNDGYIDIFDMIEVENAANNFQEGYIITDITGDSYVDIFDMIIVENNANNFVEVKRP